MNILFVCTGNICRSPMAEGIANSLIEDERSGRVVDLGIGSAGTAGWEGDPATPEAVRALADRGIDIANHEARRLSVELVSWADIIPVMEWSHVDAVGALGPGRGKAFPLLLLGEVAARLLAGADDEAPDRLSMEERASCLMDRTLSDDWESKRGGLGARYDVSDPLGYSLSYYIEVAQQMDRPIRALLEWICGESGDR